MQPKKKEVTLSFVDWPFFRVLAGIVVGVIASCQCPVALVEALCGLVGSSAAVAPTNTKTSGRNGRARGKKASNGDTTSIRGLLPHRFLVTFGILPGLLLPLPIRDRANPARPCAKGSQKRKARKKVKKKRKMQASETEDAQTTDDARQDLPAVHVVVCTDSHDTIAVDGVLPWIFRAGCQRASLDALVKDAPVVIGSRSTSAFGGVLPSSRVIILSRGGARPVGVWSRAHLAQSPEAALAMCTGEPVLYVLGGASTFAAFMPHAAVVHRIVVTGHDARPWPPEAAVAYFPWLGRAGGRSTVCGPIVPGREGGCSHQVRSDTLAPYDPIPPPPPRVDPFAEDPDLQQAMMLSFYEHAARSTAPASVCSRSALPAGSAATITSKFRDQTADTDDQDWYVDGGDDDTAAVDDYGRDDDWWITDGDDDDTDDDHDKEDEDEDDDRGNRDDTSDDDPEKDASLSSRWSTPRASPPKPPRGCMVTLLGRQNMALAGAVIARLDREDLLSLWHTSPGTRAVLVDVLTTGPSSPCSDLVHIGSHGDGAETTITRAVQVCPQDEPRCRRTGAAWLWLDVLPRLQSKCAAAERMLARPAAYSSRADLVDYMPGTLERAVAWASATRCGAAVNACLAIGDSMSAASTAYNWSDGFVKRGASAGPVSMWLAGAMGAEDGTAADLATTDVWLSAIGLAIAAGRLRCELLLSLARRIAAYNVATRRRFAGARRCFADARRRAAQPGHPDALACVASARLILGLLRGLAQTRHALDPPVSTETYNDDDEQVARFLERVCDVGLADDVACIARALDAHDSAGIALAEVCCRLRDMATRDASRRARAAGAVLARVFAIVSPINCDRGLRQESWTMRMWPAFGAALAKADVDSFWSSLHPEPDSASALAVRGRYENDVSSADLAGNGPTAGPVCAAAGNNGAANCAVGSDAAVQTGNDDNDNNDSGGLDLLSLFEHETDLCTEVIARLPPWDLISLATASRRAMRSLWAAVCRASLGAGDPRLAGIACAGAIAIDGGLSVPMAPDREAGFGHIAGALMLACHRMPRMEMMADDAEALAVAPSALDGDHAERLWALQRDPNLPAMLADTVAYAARLGCGAVLARCLHVARRMEDIVRRSGHAIARSSGLGSWLNDQMGAVHRTSPVTAAGGAWLPVAALAYIGGHERSLVLVSAVCSQISASPTQLPTRLATTFWSAGGRRVVLPKVEARAAMDPTCRIALVLVACLWGMADRTVHPQRETDRGADDAFLLGLEPLAEFLDSCKDDDGSAHAAARAPPAVTVLDETLQFMQGVYASQEANTASLCLIARLLVAPPGRPLPADSVRAHIANLLVRAASRASSS